jgi:hypothetical protein
MLNLIDDALTGSSRSTLPVTIDTWFHPIGEELIYGNIYLILELSTKYSKESTKTLCLLKTENKVVEVG